MPALDPGRYAAANSWTWLNTSWMATTEAWLPVQHVLTYLQHTTQWTIDLSSRNYMTLQKTAHYAELFKQCCQVDYYMLSWTTTAADGFTISNTVKIYTNDHPLHDGTRNFVYADDICVTAHYPSFTDADHTIEEALDELTIYYRSNSLRANPDKSTVSLEEPRGKEDVRSQMK